jgi:hypothetical protein
MIETYSRDMANTFLKELLKKPAIKDDVRAVLKSMDGPDVGRELVRTFLWQDCEFSLGLLSGLPAIANVLIRAFDEVLTQVDDKFSPELLHSFMESILADIDTETLAKAMRKLRPIVENLAPLFKQAWQEALQEGERP